MCNQHFELLNSTETERGQQWHTGLDSVASGSHLCVGLTATSDKTARLNMTLAVEQDIKPQIQSLATETENNYWPYGSLGPENDLTILLSFFAIPD